MALGIFDYLQQILHKLGHVIVASFFPCGTEQLLHLVETTLHILHALMLVDDVHFKSTCIAHVLRIHSRVRDTLSLLNVASNCHVPIIRSFDIKLNFLDGFGLLEASLGI